MTINHFILLAKTAAEQIESEYPHHGHGHGHITVKGREFFVALQQKEEGCQAFYVGYGNSYANGHFVLCDGEINAVVIDSVGGAILL